MLKKGLIALIFSGLIFGSFAQNQFKQIVPAIGTSHNFYRVVHKIPYRDYENSFNYTPGIYGSFDWGLFKFFSFGGGFNWQSHILSVNDYQYTATNNSVVVEDIQVRIRTSSVFLRALIHWGIDDNLDAYIGGQQTAHFVNRESSVDDPNFSGNNSFWEDYIAGVAGIRYYPIEQFGLFIETAFPSTYTFSAGICFRNDPAPFTWGFPFRWLN